MISDTDKVKLIHDIIDDTTEYGALYDNDKYNSGILDAIYMITKYGEEDADRD